MNYRILGRTGLEVSEIGYGTWGMGGNRWLDGSDEENIASLKRAFELGVNFVDTALAYGDGHSEELIRRAVKESGKKIHVATKIPPINLEWPAKKGTGFHEAFTYDHIIKCTDMSLRNHYFTPARRKEVIARVDKLKKLLGNEARTLPELALRFVLQSETVSTVIPGMRRVGHVEANCAASDRRRLSEELIAALKEYHFYV